MTSPPKWIRELANSVAGELESGDLPVPLGCHFALVGREWEVTLFAGYTEVVGGPNDGACHDPSFVLNVMQVLGLFDEVHSCSWQSQGMGPSDELGPNISVSGIHRGRSVWLRILSEPPARFPIKQQAHARQRLYPDSV